MEFLERKYGLVTGLFLSTVSTMSMTSITSYMPVIVITLFI